MDILFDGRVFQFQRAGGINRYFAEIISGLPPDWRPVVSGAKEFGENVPSHPNLKIKVPPRFRPGRVMQRFNRIWWLPRLANQVSLVHPTYYDLTCGFQYSDFKCPVVTTVYDMIYARFPKQTEGAGPIIHAQREAILRADRVVCISESTRQDLSEYFPEANGKAEVIHLGSSFASKKTSERNDLFEKPTFIFVGGRGGYKNFIFLLHAFAKAAQVVPGIQLKVAGAPLTSEERWQMFFLGISDQVTSVVFPDEAALEQLYHQSVALLYPSRYEGFGIPPLEAMACGTIAVTANATSLPEVVGDGGIMLDPADQDAWTDCIIKLARPFAERSDLLQRGQKRVGQFTWSKCVQRHLEVYRNLSR
jgi:glycosyltransferase involved in cell wall biosynthesis